MPTSRHTLRYLVLHPPAKPDAEKQSCSTSCGCDLKNLREFLQVQAASALSRCARQTCARGISTHPGPSSKHIKNRPLRGEPPEVPTLLGAWEKTRESYSASAHKPLRTFL